jgi:hypothetical protein
VAIEEPKEVLKRFEPEGELYKFRNTAIYYCFKRNLSMNVRELAKISSTRVSKTKINGKG